MTTTAVTAESLSAARPHGHWRWVTVALLLAALWTWAIAGCADEWLDNPMYSYGWFVPPLVLFFAWRRLDEPLVGREPFGPPRVPGLSFWIGLGAAFLAVFVLPIELLRNELPDDRLNNWGVSLTAVLVTLWVASRVGGPKLLVSLAFPIAFFLTAVAWPKRYETPVTVGLQKFVATVIVEVMHVMGIYAEPHGTTIYMRNGPVGIAEACSGIRSLQASLMISLAIGELFFLRWSRRLLLVVLCAALAAVLNLGRTLSLCLITEYKGADAMHKAHDYIGDAILLILPLLAWGVGRLLASGNGACRTAPLPRKPAADGSPPPISHWKRLWAQTKSLDWGRMPNFAPALAIGFAGCLTYHVWLMVLDHRSPPQQAPFFTVQTGKSTDTKQDEISPDIWAALSPTSGGGYTRNQPDVPGGRVHLYHFFWKPAAANRWVTGHRPDICMPAGGWKKDGETEPIDIEFNGHRVQMTLFRFAGVGQKALQLWGIWRNGEPIQMDFFTNPKLEWSVLTGKSRSAVEVLSCVVPYADEEPPLELARRLLGLIITYHRPAVDGSAPDEAEQSPSAEATPTVPQIGLSNASASTR